jgi:hypothetical protein
MAIPVIERVNYFERQYLSWKDLKLDQNYHMEMRRRQELSQHLWGIVFGLQILQDKVSGEWALQPGMAVDAYGREVYVPAVEALDTSAIANYLAGQGLPALVKVWLAYDPEKSTPPAPGWQVCGAGTQYTRVDEGFQILYKNVQDVFPKGDDPSTWPPVYLDLPDDPKANPWPVYLGTVIWDVDPSNPPNPIITNVVSPDPADKRARRYIDIVAAEILGPVNRIKMKSADLSAPDPLPSDPTKPGYAGIAVEILGSLTVDRNATTDVLITKSGHLVTASPDGGLYLDSGPPSATNKAGVWFVSDTTLGDDSASTNLMRLTDKGNLGIGNFSPVSLLEIAGDIAIDQMPAAGPKVLPAGGTMVWNDGTYLRLNENLDNSQLVAAVHTPVLLASQFIGASTTTPDRPLTVQGTGPNQELVSFQDPGGITRWHMNEHLNGVSALNFVETGVADGRLFLQAGGNTGIGTVTPRARLDVAGSAWFSNRIGAFNFDPDNGYPFGWAGGIHTWDLYAEGTIGAGAGGVLAASVDRNGVAAFSGNLTVGPNRTPVTSINPDGTASFGGLVFAPNLTVGSAINCHTFDCTTINCTTINKTFNNFRIDHPLDPTKYLIHSALEGPENAVFYRGEAQLLDGSATIDLPAYFEALTRPSGRTAMVTPIHEDEAKTSPLAVSQITNGKFTVVAVNRQNVSQKFFWEVKATRNDVPPTAVEQVKPQPPSSPQNASPQKRSNP